MASSAEHVAVAVDRAPRWTEARARKRHATAHLQVVH
jgi:hypothetical protein